MAKCKEDCLDCMNVSCCNEEYKDYVYIDSNGYVDVDAVARGIDGEYMGVDEATYGSYGNR